MRWLAASLIVLYAGFAAGADARGELPGAVKRILAAHRMPVSGFSAYVHEVGAAAPLLEVNADAPRNPASTIKLLTTWAALERLGPTYRWKTEAYLGGEIRNGTIDADLYLKGYGDPFLVTERLWLLLRELRGHGLRHVMGDLVIDNGYFASEGGDPGAFDGEPWRIYNVRPDALLVNFQAIRYSLHPDAAANRVRLVADPLPANLDLRNQLRLVNRRCGGYRHGIDMSVGNAPANDRVIFNGRFGRGCPPYEVTRSALTAPSYAYGVVKSLWEESGGTLLGKFRVEPVPEDLEPLVIFWSPPLADLIRSINKYSNNVMTRHLMLTMAAEAGHVPATESAGRAELARVVAEAGLAMPELVIDNGSGLSRRVRISARSLGRLLLHAGEGPLGPEYISSLALSGLDGTLRRRFREAPMTGRMHLKTGRLDGVFAMAGYVVAESGRQFIVVALQNTPDAHRGPGEEAQSALMRWVFKQ